MWPGAIGEHPRGVVGRCLASFLTEAQGEVREGRGGLEGDVVVAHASEDGERMLELEFQLLCCDDGAVDQLDGHVA